MLLREDYQPGGTTIIRLSCSTCATTIALIGRMILSTTSRRIYGLDHDVKVLKRCTTV